MTAVGRQVADREAAVDRRDSFFVIFATPRFTIQSYVIANALGWKPP